MGSTTTTRPFVKDSLLFALAPGSAVFIAMSIHRLFVTDLVTVLTRDPLFLTYTCLPTNRPERAALHLHMSMEPIPLLLGFSFLLC